MGDRRYSLTPLGDVLLFAGADEEAGGELWMTDGTAAGTTLVEAINPGIFGSRPETLIALGGNVLFVTEDAGSRRELWAVSPVTTDRPIMPPVTPPEEAFSGSVAEASTLDEIVSASDYNPDL